MAGEKKAKRGREKKKKSGRVAAVSVIVIVIGSLNLLGTNRSRSDCPGIYSRCALRAERERRISSTYERSPCRGGDANVPVKRLRNPPTTTTTTTTAEPQNKTICASFKDAYRERERERERRRTLISRDTGEKERACGI